MILENETKNKCRFYLYEHIRTDKNEVFYVGIGKKYNHLNDFTRAKAKGRERNCIWRRIVEKTDYRIKIVFESDNRKEVEQLEIDLIKKYGKLKNGGTLCNLSDGGEGALGIDKSHLWKPVFLYHKTGEFYKKFDSHISCSKELNIVRNVIGNSINKDFLVKEYIIKNYKKDKVDPILDIREKLKSRLSKPVFQYDENGIFIKGWKSSSEAQRELGISGGHIREVIRGNTVRKTAGGFIWKNKLC